MNLTKKSVIKKHRNLFSLLFSLLMGVCNLAYAVPVDPLAKDVTHLFSIGINNSFYLYADNEEDDLVWYISRSGKIADDNTGFGFPEFDIGSIYSDRSDFFYGEELVWIRGAFDTSGEDNLIQALWEEANQKGYRIKSPKAKSVTTFFMLSGIDATELNLDCSKSMLVNGMDMPLCFVIDENGEETSVDFISMFRSKLPEETLTQYIGFHGLTTPGWVENIKDLMGLELDVDDPNAGQNWNDKIQVVSIWELETAVDRPVATAEIDWWKIGRSAIEYSEEYDGYLTKHQLDNFYQQLIQGAIDSTETNGLRLYFTESMPDLRIIKAEIKNLLTGKLFNGTLRFVNPAADRMPDQSYRYVKRWVPIFNDGITIFVEADVKDFPEVVYFVDSDWQFPNVTWTFEYGPDTIVHSPQTIMTIECLKGGWHTPILRVTNDYCTSE